MKNLLWYDKSLDEFGLADDSTYENLLKENKYMAGIVFNFDEHNQSGSHWVSLFFNLKTGDIFYFDSVGHPKRNTKDGSDRGYARKPHHNIQKLVDQKLIPFLKKKGIEPNYIFNKTAHQQKDSECGVYAEHFIEGMLKTGTNYLTNPNGQPDIREEQRKQHDFFNKMEKTIISDEEINKRRKVIFRRI